MHTQHDLFADRDRSIQERFEQFDREHPEVYELFKRVAVRLLNAGRSHYGADAIIQVIRFEHAINQNREPGTFKLNDHFSSRYARKLAAEDTRFAEFFEFRVLKSA